MLADKQALLECHDAAGEVQRKSGGRKWGQCEVQLEGGGKWGQCEVQLEGGGI